MTTICSTPTCDERYDGPAAEAESKGGWRIRQRGPVCPACFVLIEKFGVANSSTPIPISVLVDRMPTSEELAMRVDELERQLADARRDNAHLNTIIDTYQRHDLEQFTELEGRGK